MISEPKEYFIKQKLHRGGEECSVAEDVEDVFGFRNEERFALFDVDAVDVRFALRVLCRKKLRDSDEKKREKATHRSGSLPRKY